MKQERQGDYDLKGRKEYRGQECQLKTQLLESLSLASSSEQVMAVQVMWATQPYLAARALKSSLG